MTLGFAAALFFSSAAAQEKCLQPGKLDEIRKHIGDGTEQPPNAELGPELVKAAQDLSAATRRAQVTERENEKAQRDLTDLANSTTTRVCSILDSQGWPKTTSIGEGGSNAFVYLIARALPLKFQLELYPLVSDAFAKGEIKGGEVLASYVDRLRLALGRKQLYGSQVIVKDGFLVMAPIESASEVDKRRTAFGLQPLRSYERFLEITYRMPLIRSVMEPIKTEEVKPASTASNPTSGLGEITGEEPVINVETAFVSLDVVVQDAADPRSTTLEKTDLRLFDNGKPVEIETFTKADAPFDIVLLLDLSSSTADQVGLIKKTTRRFVEMKRPGDRLAIVTFHDTQTIVSELEADKSVLLERIKKIDGRGASRVWEAVKFAMDLLEQKSEKNRRKAIVLMSDGVDNLLSFHATLTPRMGFADLVESIQRSNVSVFPIYLDTEGSDPESKRIYADARRTLRYIADQSAGNMYTAKKLDDLAGIYDRVLKDVGTVYTLGFTPDVEPGDPSWRTLRVEIPSKPGLKLKHRPGYFTK